MAIVDGTQPSEIIEGVCDELFAARVLRLRCFSKQLYQVLCLGGSFRPCLCRGGHKEFFEFLLTLPQLYLIGLKVPQFLPAGFRCLLSGHTTVLIQVDWFVRHAVPPSLLSCPEPNQATRLPDTGPTSFKYIEIDHVSSAMAISTRSIVTQ